MKQSERWMWLTLGLISLGIAAYAAVQDAIVTAQDLRTITEAARRTLPSFTDLGALRWRSATGSLQLRRLPASQHFKPGNAISQPIENGVSVDLIRTVRL
jgi:hypothetical protein